MGYAYLFALIVGLGILTVQVLLGGKDTAGKDLDGVKDVDGLDEIEAGKDLVHAGDTQPSGGLTGADLLAMFASVRFWVFASLAFGLSGSLLTYMSDVPALITAIVASALGFGAGAGASISWRLLNRGSGQLTEDKRAA